jgi:hypothetical protein
MKCEAPLAELASDDNHNVYVDLVYKTDGYASLRA